MRILRIGTRRSRLATVQAEAVRELLRRQGVEAELVPMTTSGDEGTPASDSPTGLKGLWIDTILEGLRTGELDMAVHSAKDLPAEEDEDLTIGAVPLREDPRDVAVFADRRALGPGMVVGTSSIRRRALIQAAFPGIAVADMRGNVDTRLRKLEAGEVDALLLAAAGLARLGLAPQIARPLAVDQMLPAPGQGCLAVQHRKGDRDVGAVLTLLDHHSSHVALDAERSLMRRLGGGCALPLGALAVMRRDIVRLAACVATPDGAKVVRGAAESSDPQRAVAMVADQLAAGGAEAILDEARRSI